LAADLSDYVSGSADQEFFIAIGRTKKQVLGDIGPTLWYLIKACILTELYRKASTDDEEAVSMDDLMDAIVDSVDNATK
jgi:hypothetical protein